MNQRPDSDPNKNSKSIKLSKWAIIAISLSCVFAFAIIIFVSYHAQKKKHKCAGTIKWNFDWFAFSKSIRKIRKTLNLLYLLYFEPIEMKTHEIKSFSFHFFFYSMGKVKI